ncbi:cache domain-containing sensor histidine kinase [Paenibacillus methanolicus]|uniref:histidine kinase n=1 Tax=Paenibacillus methanolicus TaxID=582686 RepID=A0A5S5BV79_9BACL|nr:sensor histidine kinase [Paenibacillus methanolicus]TYP71091.1 histidine kinase/DNA gyrase B/HSP90-like ATPase [Paenibacillus methanolicus]
MIRLLRTSFMSKFLFIFLLFIPLPMFLAKSYLSGKIIDVLVETNQNKNLQLTEQIAVNIKETMRKYIITAASVNFDSDGIHYEDTIIPAINRWHVSADEYEKLQLSDQINKRMNYFFNYTTDLLGVFFVFPDNRYYGYRNSIPNAPGEMRAMPWYGQLKRETPGSVMVVGKMRNTLSPLTHGQSAIGLAAFPPSPGNETIDYIYFALKPDWLDNAFTDMKLSHIGQVDIFTADQQSLTRSDRSDPMLDILKDTPVWKQNYGSFHYKRDGQDLLINYYTVDNTGWKVVSTISYGELTNSVQKVVGVTSIVLLAVTLLYLAVFVTSATTTVLVPIQRLIKQMRRVQQGNLKATLAINGKDEFAHLHGAFNSMVGEIKQLIRNIEDEKQEKLLMEIRALQYQINPHFLFNTLHSISVMARTYGIYNIQMMTESLTNLLHNTMDKGAHVISLAEEVQLLEHYTYLMAFRYQDKFEVQFDVPVEIRQAVILKFLLQPVLENAIIHASDDPFRKLNIRVGAYRIDNRLRIEISDDGQGMPAEQVERLLDSPKEKYDAFNKIGIYNVHRRLRLTYGEPYGVHISSQWGAGTTVTLELPYIEPTEDITHA